MCPCPFQLNPGCTRSSTHNSTFAITRRPDVMKFLPRELIQPRLETVFYKTASHCNSISGFTNPTRNLFWIPNSAIQPLPKSSHLMAIARVAREWPFLCLLRVCHSSTKEQHAKPLLTHRTDLHSRAGARDRDSPDLRDDFTIPQPSTRHSERWHTSGSSFRQPFRRAPEPERQPAWLGRRRAQADAGTKSQT